MQLVNSLMIVFALVQAPRAAEPPIPFQVPSGAVAAEQLNSLQTREVLQQTIRQYAPSLGEVFRLDPALLTNQAFLAPYPRLAEFLKQHPEIAHNPRFYVGDFYSDFGRVQTPEERSSEMFEHIMAGIAIFTSGLILISVFCWIVKTTVDHRRWLRVSKSQTEVHSKLLDRFTSNQDLLAYVQTPAGRHFLESAPISIDPAMRTSGAPAGRIIFSVQAGIVLALAGVGLNLVSRTIRTPDVAEPLLVVGMLATAVGIGFVLSAAAAYVISQRLGLLDRRPSTSTSGHEGVSPPNA